MTLLGIVLMALGTRAACDNDNQVYQTVSGILVALVGVVLVVADQTHLLDGVLR